jgi:hypothetical protein
MKFKRVSRHSIAAILLSDQIIRYIRRELKKLSPGVKIDLSEIKGVLRSEVIKIDVIEGEEAKKAQTLIKKLGEKVSCKAKQKVDVKESHPQKKVSFSDQLLKELENHDMTDN